MPQNEFKIGDVVVLKSGSQNFVVSYVENNLIICTYWDTQERKIRYTEKLDYALFNHVQ